MIYKKHISSLDEAKKYPRRFKNCAAETFFGFFVGFSESYKSDNGESEKFLFKTRDGRLLESVLIAQQGRRTVCFHAARLQNRLHVCASGKGKFGRNLSAGESWSKSRRSNEKPVSASAILCFMGMGEPLDNFDATMKRSRFCKANGDLFGRAANYGLHFRHHTKNLEFVKRSEGRVRFLFRCTRARKLNAVSWFDQ